jgi:hypothetical protein
MNEQVKHALERDRTMQFKLRDPHGNKIELRCSTLIQEA